ncbi:MAG TPA: YcnI family protein [Ilumatobacteraceae bacterium]|nr:YcnI family protein [Ilumatobacteraceae bacterium]
MSSSRRVATATAVTTCAVLALATPAFAHIDPDPQEAPAGSEQSVGFTVQHGCDGSPTIQLDMRLPEGVSSAVPQPPDEWTGTLDGNVVTFAGGPLADDVELTFRVSMILPTLPDTTIFFPFVQRCELGEIRWIDIPQDDSGEELDEPAPAMLLTAALPGTTEPPSPTSSAAPSTSPTTSSPPATSSSIPASTNLSGSSLPPMSTPSASAPLGNEDVSKGGAGSFIFVGVIIVLVAGASVLTRQARRRR